MQFWGQRKLCHTLKSQANLERKVLFEAKVAIFQIHHFKRHCCAKYLILNFHLLKHRFSLVTGNHGNFGKFFFFNFADFIYTIYLYNYFFGRDLFFKGSFPLNPFQTSVAFHIETSHLFCSENQMTFEIQDWAEIK